jgi:hypothetical protein
MIEMMYAHAYPWIFGTSTSIGTSATYNKVTYTYSFLGFQHGAKVLILHMGWSVMFECMITKCQRGVF